MIYFDHAATTKIHPEVIDAMTTHLKECYGNPSSLHDPGIKARKIVNQVKNNLASMLNCSRKNILFTGSGTEANNLAIKGVYFSDPSKKIVTSSIEHHATESTVKFIEKIGGNTAWVDVDRDGFINLDELDKSLDENTSLLTLIYANNEIGTIQPLKKILALTKPKGIKVHLDMVQAPLHMPIDVEELDVDFISLSAHKFHGPRGIGCLIVKDLTTLTPLIHGGQQEFKHRAGTENVANMIGFNMALTMAQHQHKPHQVKMNQLSHYLIEQLNIHRLPYRLNGPDLDHSRLNNILNIGFKHQDAQDLAFQLNQEGIYVSLGSACDSESIDVSHVLKAINVPKDYIEGSMRISLSDEHTKQDIDIFINTLKTLIKERA